MPAPILAAMAWTGLRWVAKKAIKRIAKKKWKKPKYKGVGSGRTAAEQALNKKAVSQSTAYKKRKAKYSKPKPKSTKTVVKKTRVPREIKHKKTKTQIQHEGALKRAKKDWEKNPY